MGIGEIVWDMLEMGVAVSLFLILVGIFLFGTVEFYESDPVVLGIEILILVLAIVKIGLTFIGHLKEE